MLFDSQCLVNSVEPIRLLLNVCEHEVVKEQIHEGLLSSGSFGHIYLFLNVSGSEFHSRSSEDIDRMNIFIILASS